MKIVCVCDTGVVVSLMMALKVKQVLIESGISAQVDYMEMDSLASSDADLYIVSEIMMKRSPIAAIDRNKLISLKRICDEQEIKNKLKTKLSSGVIKK